MKVKVLQTPTLGYIIGEFEDFGDDYKLVNPRIIQAFSVPEPVYSPDGEMIYLSNGQPKTVSKLQVNLLPVVYNEILDSKFLEEQSFSITLRKSDNVDVTEAFSVGIKEMYKGIISEIEEINNSEEKEDNIVKFTD